MHIDIWSNLAFWAVIALTYWLPIRIYEWLKTNKTLRAALLAYLTIIGVLTITIYGVSQWHWVLPAKREAKANFYGVPIIDQLQSLDGQIFSPKVAFVVENHILLVAQDYKIYALDGITLAGITVEQLTTATNATYIVYKKNGTLVLSKLQ